MGNHADNIIDLYHRHANAWFGARLREAHLYERGWLEKFCGLICAGGSVLDIGCAAGEPVATFLIQHGYSVTGVDSSRAMIELFRKRLPDQEAFVADMRMLSDIVATVPEDPSCGGRTVWLAQLR
jgi:2-polyprenyl-3-methyl-5-hydroxy-6-metoxy-1,4-benzoquinol methylase